MMTTSLAVQESKDPSSPISMSNETRKHGSTDYATDGTDVSTPNNSDPHVNFDSPNFILPEIDELANYCCDDEETQISSMSRMSAPFIQFSPSIQQDPASELTRMGLSTVEAANKPDHVECVTSVNFLSDEALQQQPLPTQPPMQVQVMRKSRNRPQRKGSIGRAPVPLHRDKLPSDDSSDLFSVRSEPTSRLSLSMARASSMVNQNQRAPLPGPIPKQIVERKPAKRQSQNVNAAPLPISDLRRSNSLPPGARPEPDASQLECIAAEVSWLAQESTSNAPSPFSASRKLSLQPDSWSVNEIVPPTPTPINRRSSRGLPQSAKEKKEKKSMFSKVFSNQIQADYEEDFVQRYAARMEAKASRCGTEHLEYGIEQDDLREVIDSRHSAVLRTSKLSSQRSLGESSTQSSQYQRESLHRNGETHAPSCSLNCDDLDNASARTMESEFSKRDNAGKVLGGLFRRKSKDADDVPVA